MNPKIAAQAYRTLAEGYSLLAVALEGDNDAAGAVVVSPPVAAPALAPLPQPGMALTDTAGHPIPNSAQAARYVDTGGRCPAHDAEFRPGNYGLYCPAKGTEPAWTNRKGYCTITPESAGNWLAIHAAAQR